MRKNESRCQDERNEWKRQSVAHFGLKERVSCQKERGATGANLKFWFRQESDKGQFKRAEVIMRLQYGCFVSKNLIGRVKIYMEYVEKLYARKSAVLDLYYPT